MIEHMSQSGSPQYFRRLFFNFARLMSCFGSLGFNVKGVEHGKVNLHYHARRDET
jgi:hypothetical protein